MKKRFFFIFLLIIGLMLGVGCSKSENGNPIDNNQPETEHLELGNSSDRKIIYYINTNLEVKYIDDAIEAITNAKRTDEWFESMNISSSSATIVVRVKSDRVEQFKEALGNIGTISNYKLKATDVSLDYAGTQEQIAAYEAERARLIALYENASISDMIEINRRIGEIDTKLQRLNRQKNEYDSLIYYSSFTINLYGEEVVKSQNFVTKIKNAFLGGLKVFVTFWQYVFLAILAILPFAAVIVAGFFIYKTIKKRKNKNM